MPSSSAASNLCLVAEDQALIGMMIEDHLVDAGLGVIGPHASCRAAIACLAHHAPALALIDYMLVDGDCSELARELKTRGVPFAVFSGYNGWGEGEKPEFDGILWLDKPVRSDALDAVVGELLANSPHAA